MAGGSFLWLRPRTENWNLQNMLQMHSEMNYTSAELQLHLLTAGARELLGQSLEITDAVGQSLLLVDSAARLLTSMKSLGLLNRGSPERSGWFRIASSF
jgi:hypothetical protein